MKLTGIHTRKILRNHIMMLYTYGPKTSKQFLCVCVVLMFFKKVHIWSAEEMKGSFPKLWIYGHVEILLYIRYALVRSDWWMIFLAWIWRPVAWVGIMLGLLKEWKDNLKPNKFSNSYNILDGIIIIWRWWDYHKKFRTSNEEACTCRRVWSNGRHFHLDVPWSYNPSRH